MSCLGVEDLSDEHTFAYGASHNGYSKQATAGAEERELLRIAAHLE
jgi:hypothetical protein